MSVKELSREQLIELKAMFYAENNNNVSWGELANVDELVSDETIFNEYSGTIFTNDDFFCTCGK